MLALSRVAVTGGLSCGKSSVCRILKELGAYVISADEIVHQLLSSDTNLGQEVVKLLGKGILVNHKIDRSRIAQLVFRNTKLLQDLEKLLHPAVYKNIDDEYQNQCHRQSHSLFVAEVPLLFESEGEHFFDYTVAIVSDPELCVKRFQDTTGYDQKEFESRAARQWPMLEKAVKADYVIMNNGSLSNLRDVTQELYQELIEMT